MSDDSYLSYITWSIVFYYFYSCGVSLVKTRHGLRNLSEEAASFIIQYDMYSRRDLTQRLKGASERAGGEWRRTIVELEDVVWMRWYVDVGEESQGNELSSFRADAAALTEYRLCTVLWDMCTHTFVNLLFIHSSMTSAQVSSSSRSSNYNTIHWKINLKLQSSMRQKSKNSVHEVEFNCSIYIDWRELVQCISNCIKMVITDVVL